MSGDCGIEFFGQRAVDALVVHGAVRRVVACEGGAEAAAVGTRLGAEIEALEDRLGIRRPWSNATVGAAAAAFARPRRGTRVVPYASSVEIRDIAASADAVVLAPPPELKAALDDKIGVRRALAARGLPVPVYAVVGPDEVELDSLAARFGLPVVLQARVGASGRGTWFVTNSRDVDAAREEAHAGQPLLASEYVGETTINLHGVVLGAGRVALSAPSVQAVGVPELVRSATHYCGNDFTRGQAWSATSADLVGHAESVGRWLESLGYRGVFGLDFVISGGVVHLIDLNPRFQGSSWLLAELERAAGGTPLGALHLAAWTGPRDDASVDRSEDVRGSMLVLHHLGAKPVRSSGTPAPGIYRIDGDGGLLRRRTGLSPADCAPDEFVVGGVAAAGVVVEPGAVLARLSSRASLLLEGGRGLTAHGASLVRAVRAALSADAAQENRFKKLNSA